MSKPWLIIGDGLAACVLAMTCHRSGISFRMIGGDVEGAASMASSGLINPITGRRYAKSWMIDTLLVAAKDFYSWSGQVLGQTFFRPTEIVRFLSSPAAQQIWSERERDPAFHAFISREEPAGRGGFDKPYFVLKEAWLLDTPGWISAVRRFLAAQDAWIAPAATGISHGPVIRALGAFDAPLPPGLIPNKGEALIVRMTDWPHNIVIKGEVFVVPLADPCTYWVGSGYDRWPVSHAPTSPERERILTSLRKIHTGDVELLRQLAGVRPTTADRRPLIGLDARYPGDYIFNGLGTKGTSLAPYWAGQLVRNILYAEPLPPEVDPARFIRPKKI